MKLANSKFQAKIIHGVEINKYLDIFYLCEFKMLIKLINIRYFLGSYGWMELSTNSKPLILYIMGSNIWRLNIRFIPQICSPNFLSLTFCHHLGNLFLKCVIHLQISNLVWNQWHLRWHCVGEKLRYGYSLVSQISQFQYLPEECKI